MAVPDEIQNCRWRSGVGITREHTLPNDLLCQMYRPIKETPCHFITTLDELVELNGKLMKCKEFALDLEVIKWPFLFKGCTSSVST